MKKEEEEEDEKENDERRRIETKRRPSDMTTRYPAQEILGV
jgi:hypothetical protein